MMGADDPISHAYDVALRNVVFMGYPSLWVASHSRASGADMLDHSTCGAYGSAGDKLIQQST